MVFIISSIILTSFIVHEHLLTNCQVAYEAYDVSFTFSRVKQHSTPVTKP